MDHCLTSPTMKLKSCCGFVAYTYCIFCHGNNKNVDQQVLLMSSDLLGAQSAHRQFNLEQHQQCYQAVPICIVPTCWMAALWWKQQQLRIICGPSTNTKRVPPSIIEEELLHKQMIQLLLQSFWEDQTLSLKVKPLWIRKLEQKLKNATSHTSGGFISGSKQSLTTWAQRHSTLLKNKKPIQLYWQEGSNVDDNLV